jgi:hypothetical protein
MNGKKAVVAYFKVLFPQKLSVNTDRHSNVNLPLCCLVSRACRHFAVFALSFLAGFSALQQYDTGKISFGKVLLELVRTYSLATQPD